MWVEFVIVLYNCEKQQRRKVILALGLWSSNMIWTVWFCAVCHAQSVGLSVGVVMQPNDGPLVGHVNRWPLEFDIHMFRIYFCIILTPDKKIKTWWKPCSKDWVVFALFFEVSCVSEEMFLEILLLKWKLSHLTTLLILPYRTLFFFIYFFNSLACLGHVSHQQPQHSACKTLN